MKSRDFRKLNESIDFSVTKSYEDEQGRTVHDMSHFGKRQPVECWVCDGTGKDKFYDEAKCEYCEGKGKRDEFVSDAPEMNVSNSNAFKIIDMLGLEQDYAGSIENKDLPALMRKLIQLKNSDRSQYAEPGSQSGGKMTTSTDAEGMSTIGRSGPTMYNMGTTDSQITQYVDQLIKIIKFAQDNDADFGWG
jgi:hypothetical protein